jgi:hypothetical protein
MKGRTAASLLRQVHDWHRQLAGGTGRDVQDARRLVWATAGIPGFDRVEGEPGNQRRFVVTELLSSAELLADGRAMRHCVYSYATRCARGHCAIFSLRMDGGTGKGLERRATVEVTPQIKAVVQVRGRFNAEPDPVDQRVLRAWAVAAGLTVRRMG